MLVLPGNRESPSRLMLRYTTLSEDIRTLWVELEYPDGLYIFGHGTSTHPRSVHIIRLQSRY